MIVAVGLFAVVMLISVSTLLSLVNANRKAQSLQSVINNLNVAVDGMVRAVRMGSAYHCGSAGNYNTPTDCALGDTFLAFQPFHSGATAVSPWLYWYAQDENGVGRLYKSESGSISDGVAVTSPDVAIESVRFYVIGSTRGDNVQPKVLVVIKGTAGAGLLKTRSTFHVQATAVQRVLDL